MADPRRLRWLPSALRDLDRLDQFLRVRNADAADRAIIAIRDAADSIPCQPERGRPYRRAPGFRDLLVPFGRRGYVIRYRVDGDLVVVVRVWHALEDRP